LEPSPHVLADADAVCTSLIKPADAGRELFAGGLGDADQAARPEAVGGLLSHRRIDGLNTEELKKAFRFEKAIKWITRTMLRQRHGGTLLVLPDGTPLDDEVRTKYSPNSPVTSVREANVFDIKRDAERNDTIRKVLEGINEDM
jgi:hypothetical protein